LNNQNTETIADESEMAALSTFSLKQKNKKAAAIWKVSHQGTNQEKEMSHRLHVNWQINTRKQ